MKLSARQEADGWITYPGDDARDAWKAFGGRWQYMDLQSYGEAEPFRLGMTIDTWWFWRPVDPETWSWVPEWEWLYGMEKANWRYLPEDDTHQATIGRAILTVQKVGGGYQGYTPIGREGPPNQDPEKVKVHLEATVRRHLAPWAQEN